MGPSVAVCAWCATDFPVHNPNQQGALDAGRRVYCSEKCRHAMSNASYKRMFGPCPSCGKMFTSKAKKIFCSMACYASHPDTKARLASYNAERASALGSCPGCGLEFNNRKKKYCSAACRRKFYAERFDRWVANPESLRLPQCYDEFLSRDELPCLIDGCAWRGKALASHCNVTHGIPADTLRELGGFNRRTGLVSADLHKQISDRFRAMIADGRLVLTPPQDFRVCNVPRKTARAEAKEHHKKALAISASQGEDRPPRPCRLCGQDVMQPTLGRRDYCSTMCRTKYYQLIHSAELICSHCGAVFMGNMRQVRMARRGNNVCCSKECQCQMNIIAALASRGITYSPS